MKRIFKHVYEVCHVESKERIREETAEYRAKLEDEKLTMWNEKNRSLMAQIGDLENKIKMEVATREKMAYTYESSMNTGKQVFN